VLKQSCVNASEPQFLADPAVRLNAVVASAEHHAIHSLCDAVDAMPIMQDLYLQIASQLGACCFPSLPAQALDCMVSDVTTNDDGTVTTKDIPQCNLGPSPCWRIEQKVDCATVGLTVDRDGKSAPPHTITRAACVPGA
jgi:hypothetical protein